jgi:gamma-glutamylcyclotransferase (GGCT)/AIG2-like uncharacterized protein YtfP
MRKIIVYGTLKKGFGNHRLLQNAKFLGKALTKNKYKMTKSGIPFVHEDKPEVQITGEVYEVSEADMPRLDALEGFRGRRDNSFYYRKPIPVILENKEELEAEIYFSDSTGNTNVENGIY